MSGREVRKRGGKWKDTMTVTLPTQQVLRCQLLAFLPVGAGLTLCCSSLTTGHSPLGESFSRDSDLPLLFSTPRFPSHHESAGMGWSGVWRCVPFTSSCHSGHGGGAPTGKGAAVSRCSLVAARWPHVAQTHLACTVSTLLSK